MRTRVQTIFFAASLLLLTIFFLGNSKAIASIATAPDGTIIGNAWSSNIGWISFNDCSDATTCGSTAYGVSVDTTTGVLSGYAWSSNIGWISFNSVGAPASQSQSNTQAKINFSTGAVTGWARACSVFASGCSGAMVVDSTSTDIYRGGWDGYIALNATSTGQTGWGFAYNSTDKTITGNAWGSEVVGWIEAVDLKLLVQAPTVTLTANPATINKGDSSSLVWTSTNTTSCASTDANFTTSGSTPTTNGTVSVSPTVNTIYSIKCVGPGGEATQQVTVTVNPPPTTTATTGSTTGSTGGATTTGGTGSVKPKPIFKEN